MISIPFARRVLTLEPAHIIEARGFFSSDSGQAVLNMLAQLRPDAASAEAKGYEQVFDNLSILIDKQKIAEPVDKPTYPALDDSSAWNGQQPS